MQRLDRRGEAPVGFLDRAVFDGQPSDETIFILNERGGTMRDINVVMPGTGLPELEQSQIDVANKTV